MVLLDCVDVLVCLIREGLTPLGDEVVVCLIREGLTPLGDGVDDLTQERFVPLEGLNPLKGLTPLEGLMPRELEDDDENEDLLGEAAGDPGADNGCTLAKVFLSNVLGDKSLRDSDDVHVKLLPSSEFVGDTNPPFSYNLAVSLEDLCKGLELFDKGSDIRLTALSPRSKLLFIEFEAIFPPILLGHRCCSIILP